MAELAIFGGPKTRTEPYPDWPVWDQRDVDAVTAVVKSGNWGGHPYPGPQTTELAKQFSALQGGRYAVVMMNGTVTMEIACRASGIGWGDEVIVPSYTFHATASAPMAAGAIPVMVDIDPANYCLDPKAVERAITPRTRAIIPVHIAHQMADMDALMEIAEKHNLIVIEDCAHAHGAKWRGQGAGTIGHFGSFSLQSTKSLTSGEGGILLCRTPEHAATAASLIDCGRPHTLGGGPEGDGEYTMGVNYRMSELQAALAIVAVARFPEQARERETMANYMDESLSEVPGVRVLPRDPRHTQRSFYRYIFKVDPADFGVTHGPLCDALEAEGIPGCWVGYQPMHQYPLFQPQKSRLAVPSAFPEYFRFEEMRFPVAERAFEEEAVWLDESIFRAGRKGVDDVIGALKKIQRNASVLADRWKGG